MAVWSETSKFKITSFKRADAEFFRPEYTKAEERVRSIQHSNLSAFGSFVPGPFGSAFHVKNYDSESQYRYVRGKDVKPFILQNDDSVYLPKKDFLRLNKYSLQVNDLLISVVGTLGNISIVESSTTPAIFSCKSTVFRTTSNVNPYFFLAYLNSKYGKHCLLRRQRGAVQTGLNIEDLKSIPIPCLAEDLITEISSNMQRAIELFNKSKELYTQAQQLLESELGLDNLEFEKPVGYEASFSDVTNNNRCDANYYQPKYKQLDNIAAKFDVCLVREFSEKLETGQYATNYTETGYPYIRGVDIESNGYLETDSLIKTSKLPAKANNSVKQDDILVTRVGSIGVCGLIEANLSSGLFSDNLIRIRIRDNFKTRISAHCLNLLFNTTYGQMQMVRFSRGSVQQRLNQTQLGKLPIPIIPFNKQMEIESLLISHRKSKHESKQLLEQAKHRVEQLIEEAVTK